MRRCQITVILVAAFACAVRPTLAQPSDAPRRYDDHRLVHVTLKNLADVDAMLNISRDYWSENVGVGVIPFRVSPEKMGELTASGLEFNVVHDDIQILIEQQRVVRADQAVAWFADFKRYEKVNAYIDLLVALRPDLVTKLDVGLTLEGRMIHGMRISATAAAENAPALFFNGCQHAREWITPMTNMYIADQLVRGYDTDPQVQSLLDQLVFYIVPIVNVDGHVYAWDVERLWRKNRRDSGSACPGVDNNRNWGFNWGDDASSSSDPCSNGYRGTGPFSEPENQAVRDFILARPKILAHIDFHSYGQILISPHGDVGGQPPEPDRTTFQMLNIQMREAIFSVHGEVYDGVPSGRYLSGGFATWTHASEGILSWTFELRDNGTYGFLLPADQILPTAEENYAAIKVLASFLTQPFEFRYPDGRPTRVAPDTPRIMPIDIVDISGAVDQASATFFARAGSDSAFHELGLSSLGGANYEAVLPAASCGSIVGYFSRASAASGGVIFSPAGAPSVLHQAIALDVSTILYDTMETDPGWTVGDVGDGATTGIWTRVDPIGTAAQPEDDHTPTGTLCWVTGQGTAGGALGENDVDGGKTTLLTPVLDLAGADAMISYWLWYSNDTGNAPSSDTFFVDVSVDGGGSWISAETVGPTGTGTSGGWMYHELRISDVASPSANTQLRFVATDYGDGSVVEAAIDDFGVNMLYCPPQPLRVIGEGSRYLRVTPPTGFDPVALRLTSPDHPCLDRYLGADGRASETAVLLMPDDWGTVLVHGPKITPNSMYNVIVESLGGTSLEEASATTAIWGDAIGSFQDGGWTPPDGTVDIVDITASLDRFRSLLLAPVMPWCDSVPQTPDGILTIVDITHMLDAFRGEVYPFADPCFR